LKGESEFVLSGENEGVRLITDILDVRLEDMEFLRQSLMTEIVGRVKGKIAYDRKAGQSETMTARLDATDCAFDAALPMIDIGRLEFSHVAVDLSLTNRQVQIKQLDFSGSQADGQITGFVRIRAPLAQSALNLKGTFTPHPAFIAELSKKFPVQALFKSRSDRDGIGFSIRGTLAKPDFNFSRG
jgi:type II secretion system protein N